jgi:hypothetical protein
VRVVFGHQEQLGWRKQAGLPGIRRALVVTHLAETVSPQYWPTFGDGLAGLIAGAVMHPRWLY